MITDILKQFPSLEGIETAGQVTRARVARHNLAVVATALVQQHKLSLSLLFGTDDRKEQKTFGVHAVFSSPVTHERLIVSAAIPENDPTYPSLTSTIMAAHWYERYLADMFGVKPVGHPDPRRLVHHENIPAGTHPLRKDFAWNTVLSKANEPYPMHHVQGEGIYEIPVGPIHAGIIEPGHFRFNVAGERIITLEGKLFFTHKGVEKLLEGKTPMQALPFVERISGDAAASHALAFCETVEKIANVSVPERAKELRTLITELERMTMHIHDLSNIAGMGTGYTFMAAQGFRIKERLMRLSERMLGNRFWRGTIIPGGVAKDVSSEIITDIRATAQEAYKEMVEILSIGLKSDGLRERLETTGLLPLDAAEAFGALGVPARASGVRYDVRVDYPYAAYGKHTIPMVTRDTGDVYARYMVRVEELKVTHELIQKILDSLTAGPIAAPCAPTSGSALAAVESWRGEVLYFVRMTNGVIDRCVPRDPSFCNWALFGIIGPGNIVPDFPLCNKSLNLSYSGTDM